MQTINTNTKLSYRCGPAAEPLLYQTIGNVFDQTVAQYPDNLALVVKHQDIRWTYSEYQERVDKLATGLLALGIKPGDRVGIWAPNCYEWCLTQFATAKIGAIMVCVNPAYRVYELEYALNKVACKAIILAEEFKTSKYLDMLNQLVPELKSTEPGQLNSKAVPNLRTVIRMGEEKTPGMYNFDQVCQKGGDTESATLAELAIRLNPDDAINIQFTSGTTGKPKGATLTHHNILNNGNVVGNGMRLSEKDRLCIPVPLYHCFGMVMGNLACITHGSAAIFPDDSFDPVTTLQAVEQEKCTALHGVPTMFIAELDHPNFSDFDLSSLRTGIMAGSTCPTEVMNKVIDQMNLTEILIGYGQTETSPVNHMTVADDPIDKRISSVGRPGPHLEIKIVDEKNRVTVIDKPGEICVRGYSVMRGYWADDELTKETIRDGGWLYSGDQGVMDEQGYVEVVGRIKDMIIRGGENISPREIEEFLFTHPEVQDVQVFGVDDKKYGEQVAAWIKLNDSNSSITEQDVIDFCRDQISHFKVPQSIRFVDEFPMTITGKIQKYKMRDAMQEARTK